MSEHQRAPSGLIGTQSVPTDQATIELNSAFFAVNRATSKASELFTAGFELTSARIAVISILHRQLDKRLTVGEIAAGLRVSSTNISRRLDGLEKAGWVQRERNPDDGRSIYISLTPLGRERSEAILPAVYRRLNDVWSCFDVAEKEQLTRHLSRLLDHLQATHPLGPMSGK